MWLLSGTLENPEDETPMEKHGAESLYCTVKSLMHAILTKDRDAQQGAAHWMIQIAKAWVIRRWSELKHPNAKPIVWTLK